MIARIWDHKLFCGLTRLDIKLIVYVATRLLFVQCSFWRMTCPIKWELQHTCHITYLSNGNVDLTSILQESQQKFIRVCISKLSWKANIQTYVSTIQWKNKLVTYKLGHEISWQSNLRKSIKYINENMYKKPFSFPKWNI